MSRRILPVLIGLVSYAVVVLFCNPNAQAQVGVVGAPGPGQQQQQPAGAGIVIDAQGVVKPFVVPNREEKLAERRAEAFAGEHLPSDLNTFSPMRKVSLVRLEAACEEYARNQEHVPADMHFLAGLQQIDYVFVSPETNDLVIAGPAEGFAPNGEGRMVGVTTGRPPLRLDDLMVALRALERSGKLGCSIDPVQERLAAFQRYVAANSTPSTPAIAGQRYKQMARILGMQDVRVWGVPADSRFAQVLVEADYRMKRISLDLEKPRVRGFRSHLSMLRPRGNSTQRWWFTPLYDTFYTTEEGDAFEFAGQRAQLMSQEERIDGAGNRSDAPFTRVSTQAWSRLFTRKFPELVEAVPVFAELQNLFDLAVLAALLKKERLPQQVGWEPSLFLDADRAAYEEGTAPRQVHTAVNYRMAGRQMVLGLVAGGVVINPMQTVQGIQFEVDGGERRLGGTRTAALNEQPADEQSWWWD